jgi:uncharacterized protein YjbJ (UPF0337 family)
MAHPAGSREEVISMATYGRYRRRTSTAEQKLHGKAQEVSGKARKDLGRATGNPAMESEGRGRQTKGALRIAAAKLRDAFRR